MCTQPLLAPLVTQFLAIKTQDLSFLPGSCQIPSPKLRAALYVYHCHFGTCHCAWKAFIARTTLSSATRRHDRDAFTCVVIRRNTEPYLCSILNQCSFLQPQHPTGTGTRQLHLAPCDMWRLRVWDLRAGMQVWGDLWIRLSAVVSRKRVCVQRQRDIKMGSKTKKERGEVSVLGLVACDVK